MQHKFYYIMDPLFEEYYCYDLLELYINMKKDLLLLEGIFKQLLLYYHCFGALKNICCL